ncbi:MAG TPA: hypothetical protein VKG05_01020, partial [Steroidobacteraceae bacterium]|nr:hypothetical protein [Steroidobacteraceae bacterium]
MLDEVAIAYAALGAQILMLMAIVLGVFGEAYRRVAECVECGVVAATAEAIEPINQSDGPVRQLALGNRLGI